jgi:ATP-dependent helicase/DNAse subunit B
LNTTLIYGSAGSGKTEAALHVIQDSLRDDPFQTIWVLVPGELQAAAFRERLAALVGEVSFGVAVLDFYALYRRLLRLRGDPPHGLRDAARLRVLRHVISQVKGQLTVFGGIADMPGFVRVVASFIQELKRARIEPDAFLQAAGSTGRFSAKDRDLALIYGQYQQFLRDRALVDSEGEGWLALAELVAEPPLWLPANLLMIDGFDQFTVVQADLIAQLSRRIPRTVVTLSYEEARRETAHRRFAQTRALLEQAGTAFTTQRPVTAPAGRRPATLELLSARIFESSEPLPPGDSTIRFIEAPDLRREAEEALRSIKEDLLNGIPAEQIALTARDLSQYTVHLDELATAYGVPLWLRGGQPLPGNPAIIALFGLIDLARGGFARRPFMDALQSPYLTCPYLTTSQIQILDRLAREQIIVRGEDYWLKAVDRAEQRAAADPAPTDDDAAAESLEEAHYIAPLRLEPAEADALRVALRAVFERLTPPRTGTARTYSAWVEALIGPDPALADAEDETLVPEADPEQAAPPHFDLIGGIRRAAATPEAERFAVRDLHALETFLHALRDLLAGYTLLQGEAARLFDWSEFRAELGIAVQNARIDPQRAVGRTGRVLVSSVYEIRGLPHEHLYVLGLSEGQFPAPAREDAFYHDSERQILHAAGLAHLITRAQEADESSLFYELTALPRVRLTLLRTHADKGAAWPASPYWNQARALTPWAPSIRIRMAERVLPSRAASVTELFAGLAQDLSRSQPADPLTDSIAAWVAGHPVYGPRWSNALTARDAEMKRRTDQRGSYTGVITNPKLRAIIEERLGPSYLWSASQFNSLGTCPFQFFARRLLHLEPLPEPEAGLDERQRGSVVHAILEQVYRSVSALGFAILPDHGEAALRILDEAAPPIFESAPRRFGFVPDALWEQEKGAILAELRRCISEDFKGAPFGQFASMARYPAYFELPFGVDGDMLLHTSAGNLRIRGRVDRIDRAPDGRVVVIDYKSGSTPIKGEDLMSARNVQMLLYREAAQNLFREGQAEGTYAGGVFLSVRQGKSLGTVQEAQNADWFDTARARVGALVSAARRGAFPEAPSKLEDGQCSRYCDYAALCRIAVKGRSMKANSSPGTSATPSS